MIVFFDGVAEFFNDVPRWSDFPNHRVGAREDDSELKAWLASRHDRRAWLTILLLFALIASAIFLAAQVHPRGW